MIDTSLLSIYTEFSVSENVKIREGKSRNVMESVSSRRFAGRLRLTAGRTVHSQRKDWCTPPKYNKYETAFSG